MAGVAVALGVDVSSRLDSGLSANITPIVDITIITIPIITIVDMVFQLQDGLTESLPCAPGGFLAGGVPKSEVGLSLAGGVLRNAPQAVQNLAPGWLSLPHVGHWDSGDGFFTTAFLGGGGRKTENPATWVGLAFAVSISGRVEASGWVS